MVALATVGAAACTGRDMAFYHDQNTNDALKENVGESQPLLRVLTMKWLGAHRATLHVARAGARQQVCLITMP
jgi:hypothetical protein